MVEGVGLWVIMYECVGIGVGIRVLEWCGYLYYFEVVILVCENVVYVFGIRGFIILNGWGFIILFVVLKDWYFCKYLSYFLGFLFFKGYILLRFDGIIGYGGIWFECVNVCES